MVGSKRQTTTTGVVFAVSFTAGLALLGEEIAAFGDSDRAFVEHFSTGSQRGADIAGSFLLMAAAAAFAYFTHLIGSPRPEAATEGHWVARAAGMVAGVFILVAALALLTVPLSISMGEFFDEDSGAFTAGQAVLPQFGYVTLVFGAMIPAAVAIVAIARLRLFPIWLTRLSFVMATLLALTSGMVPSMVLLPAWVALATVVLRRAPKNSRPDLDYVGG